MFEWVKREYGKGEIDRAGHFLKEWWISENFEDYKEGEGLRKWNEAFRVVENWRTCHGLPLNVIQAGLRVRVRRVERRAIVAQRLKRFSSMVDKLAREDDMKLSQMQDLGGCRAIFSSVPAVTALFKMYGEPRLEEGSLKCYDYIAPVHVG